MENREYEQIISSRSSGISRNSSYVKYSIMTVIVLVLCGVSFGLGMKFQKAKQTNTFAASNINGQLPARGGGSMSGQRPNIGEVKKVSGDSITISNQQSGTNQIYKITSSTVVQNNVSTISASSIKAGDTVLVIVDSSDASIASQIMLNPSLSPPSDDGIIQSPTSTSEL